MEIRHLIAMPTRLLTVLVIFSLARAAVAAENSAVFEAPAQTATKADDDSSSGLVPIPALYYTPETSIAAGAVLIYYYRNPGDSPNTKPSQIKPIVIATGKKQLITSLLMTRRWNDGRDQVSVSGRYRRYPDKLWDIGPVSTPESEEDYSCNIAGAEAFWQHAVGGYVDVGPIVSLNTYQVTKKQKDGQLMEGQLTGVDGARSAAYGILVGHDSRDGIFAPSRGVLASLRLSRVNDMEYGHSPYDEEVIDARHYLSIVDSHILVFRLMGQRQMGDVPFRDLASLGGPERMRGYYEGRFRDKASLSAEEEYRFPLWRRLRGAFFGSVGNVGKDFDQILKTSKKFAVGGGVRYVVKEKEGISIRVDVGRTTESAGLYVQLNEAF